MNSKVPFRRRASVYVAVLGGAMMVAVIGVSTLMALRVQRRWAQASAGFANARLHARSGMELGFFRIQSDPNWRLNNPNGTWISSTALGDGGFTLQGIDPVDGVLSDLNTEPLVLTAAGWEGQSRFKLQVQLQAELLPLDALRTCLHSNGSLSVGVGEAPRFTGAPVSANGDLKNDGTIQGDAEAGSASKAGVITGSLTVPAPAKDKPDTGVFGLYESMATAIAFPTTIENRVLSPSTNPWGATNANGVYYIDTNGNDLVIRNSRILGTLVVRCISSKTVKIEQSVFMQNFRSDYPALIVECNLELNSTSATTTLSESTAGVNFNPAGTSFLGISDADLLDTYPNEIQGLIHVKGNLKMTQTARVRGAIICENAVTGLDDVQIIHNRKLYLYPPYGYTKPPVMKVAAGSWRQVVD